MGIKGCQKGRSAMGSERDTTVLRVDAANYSRFADLVYWREHGGERTPAETVPPVDLTDPNLYVYGAWVEGRFVGWISLVYIPKVGRWRRGHVYVDELWVQPEYRRQGIARALMAQADALREKLDAAGIRLYVNCENPNARSLYESCGYHWNGKADYMEK